MGSSSRTTTDCQSWSVSGHVVWEFLKIVVRSGPEQQAEIIKEVAGSSHKGCERTLLKHSHADIELGGAALHEPSPCSFLRGGVVDWRKLSEYKSLSQ